MEKVITMISRGAVAVIAAGLLVSVAGCTSSGRPPAESSPSGEPLDLVLLSDSGGWGIAEMFGPLAEDALGRDVAVHSHIIPASSAGEIRSAVEGEWADDVAGAEIVVFYVSPAGFDPPGMGICFEALDAVTDPDYDGPEWTPGTTWDPVPEMAGAGDYQEYRDGLEKVYDTIWTLREDQPTILRAYGVWNPFVGAWQEAGIGAECVSYEQASDQARREAAEANGAVYVSMLDAFSGPQHDQDPAAKGLLDEDGMHLNEDGQQLLVETLAEVGFETSQSPN